MEKSESDFMKTVHSVLGEFNHLEFEAFLLGYIRAHNESQRTAEKRTMPFISYTHHEIGYCDDAGTHIYCFTPEFGSFMPYELDNPTSYEDIDRLLNNLQAKAEELVETLYGTSLTHIDTKAITDTNWLIIITYQY